VLDPRVGDRFLKNERSRLRKRGEKESKKAWPPPAKKKTALARMPARALRCSVLSRQMDHVVGEVQRDFIHRKPVCSISLVKTMFLEASRSRVGIAEWDDIG